MAAPKIRTQIELEQPLPSFTGFTKTTTDANAMTVLDVSTVMEEANRVTFVVELGDLYINFGSAATSDGNSMLIPAGTGFTHHEEKRRRRLEDLMQASEAEQELSEQLSEVEAAEE